MDIGANLGTYSIALALSNPLAVGWAFEPNPVTYAFLLHNVEQNGLAGRIHVANAGISRDGRTLQMPRCVVAQSAGSQMASTQWRRGPDRGGMESRNACFSPSCKQKAATVRECMARDPHMLQIPSVRFADALARAAGGAGRIDGRVGAGRGGSNVSFLKIDCEGCEHEIMADLEQSVASGRVARLTGECHGMTSGLTPTQAAACVRVLRGLTCPHGISPYLTCRPPRPAMKGKAPPTTARARAQGKPASKP